MTNFLEQNSLYVVMMIVLVIWLGIFGELIRIERKIKKISEQN